MDVKEVWVKADEAKDWDDRKSLITFALESGASAIMCAPSDIEKIRGLGQARLASESNDADIILEKSAFYRVIKSKKDEEGISKLGQTAEYVIIDATDWKIIPLENIIAALQGKAKIIVKADTVAEAKTVFETLEIGADGVLVTKIDELKKIKDLAEKMSTDSLDLVPVEIVEIKPVGMGDRVCVDTCSMLSVGEGMLVGSQSNALFLVHSESIDTEYVASRPFRVNAGPVHAYVRVPGGKTRYLSEVASGDEVLACDSKGNSRVVIVGRMKIEKRPLMLVRAKKDGKEFRTLLQNAETILLVSEDHKPISISKLKPGDKILAYLEATGRHFGMAVDESIEEK